MPLPYGTRAQRLKSVKRYRKTEISLTFQKSASRKCVLLNADSVPTSPNPFLDSLRIAALPGFDLEKRALGTGQYHEKIQCLIAS